MLCLREVGALSGIAFLACIPATAAGITLTLHMSVELSYIVGPAVGSVTPPTDPPGPRRSWPRLGRTPLVAALFTIGSAVVVVPDLLFGLDRFNPFAQVVAFRPWVLVAGSGLLAALLIVLWFRIRVWPVVAGGAVVLLVDTAMLVPRLVADPPPVGGTPLAVLTFNVDAFVEAGDRRFEVAGVV